MKKYTIEVVREVPERKRLYDVKARSVKRAREQALQLAADDDWSGGDHGVDYRIPEADAAYVEAAQRLYRIDGELEIDCGAKVSHGDDDGAYVQAWVWVPRSALLPWEGRIKITEGG